MADIYINIYIYIYNRFEFLFIPSAWTKREGRRLGRGYLLRANGSRTHFEEVCMGPSDSVSSVTVSNEILRISRHFKDTGLRGNNSEKQAGSGLTSLKALVANVRSLRQACGELAATAHDTSAHVICVTETFLDGDSINPLTPDGYICAGRRDRTKHGGGVLIFLRDSLLFSAYDTSAYHIPETAEMVAVRIEELGVVIITVYAQPSEKKHRSLHCT